MTPAEYKRAWRAKNRHKLQAELEYKKQWRLENPDLWQAQQKRSRANQDKKINTDFDYFVNYTYVSLRNGAKSRDLAFNISKKQLRDMLLENPRCAISGRKVEFKKGPNKASIDRIDNRFGYSKKNVQVVVACVNQARMDSTVNDFIKLCGDVAKHAKRITR